MMRFSGLGNHGQRLVVALVLSAGAFGLSSVTAHAQKAAAKQPAKAATQSVWVKLCEKAKLRKPSKDGKAKPVTKQICLTHHERLDGNTGRVIVSAAIRQLEGSKKPILMVMVPLGVNLPSGARVTVLTKKQWARVQKKEKISEKELKPIALRYVLCHHGGCSAETVAPDGLVKSLKTGGGMVVHARGPAGQVAQFTVPLTGFAKAHDGKPIDNKAYSKARAQMMAQIHNRIRQRMAAQRSASKAPEPKQQPKK